MNTIQDERSFFFHRLLAWKLWLGWSQNWSPRFMWDDHRPFFSFPVFFEGFWGQTFPSSDSDPEATEKQREQGFTIGYLRKMITSIRGRELDNWTTIFASIYDGISKCTWGAIKSHPLNFALKVRRPKSPILGLPWSPTLQVIPEVRWISGGRRDRWTTKLGRVWGPRFRERFRVVHDFGKLLDGTMVRGPRFR